MNLLHKQTPQRWIISILTLVVLLLIAIPFGAVMAATVVDSRNARLNPAHVTAETRQEQDIGWPYVPTLSYTLGRIEAKFDGTTTFPVTVEFYQGTPGGAFTLLGSATFTATGNNNWSGGNLNNQVNVV